MVKLNQERDNFSQYQYRINIGNIGFPGSPESEQLPTTDSAL
jgi:hypothetical protein